MPIDLQQEYDQLAAFYDDTAALLDEPDAAIFDVKEKVSGWSPAHHLHHIWVANGKSLAAALLIARGRGMPDGTPNEAGRMMLEQETIPRNQFTAPESVTPPDEPDRAALDEALTRSRNKLEDVGAQLDALATGEGRLPHPRMGLLNAPQWIRFVRIHSQHHHAIIRDILAA